MNACLLHVQSRNDVCDICSYDPAHSMAKDNLNKSKETTPTTSAAIKVAP